MSEPNVLTIQFITDERLMIPGTGGVGIRGQLLEIGAGKTGAKFPYRSPREQMRHYGTQHYILIDATNPEGESYRHRDLEVLWNGEKADLIPDDQASVEPSGDHAELIKRSGIIRDSSVTMPNRVEADADEEEKKVPVKKVSTRSSKSKSSTKSESKTKTKTPRPRRPRKSKE